jgi:hypothetical protein
MRFLRSIGIALVLALVGLGLVAATPGQADAQSYRWNRWNGNSYWNSGYTTPFGNRYARPFYVWPRMAWGWGRW